MRRFAQLLAELDASAATDATDATNATNATDATDAALQRYLADADPADAAWGVYLLAGGQLPRSVPAAVLRSAGLHQADIPEWLFDTCVQTVGDLAETIALVLPPPRRRSALGLSRWICERLLPLRGVAPADQAAALAGWWDELSPDERLLLNKLVGGGFRAAVSSGQVQQALAHHAGLDVKLVAQRFLGWTDKRQVPSAQGLRALMAPPDEAVNAADLPAGLPLPFSWVAVLDRPQADLEAVLGPVSRWLAEWQFDGLRAQVVRTAAGVWIWSCTDALVNQRFPEVLAWAQALPAGIVLEGVLLAWQGDRPAPFKALQQRLDRQTVSRALLASAPVRFMACDLLAWQGCDQRSQPFSQRRRQLEALMSSQRGHLSPRVEADSWPALALRHQESRARGVGGLMLRRLDAAHGGASTQADDLCWHWPAAPNTVAAVLVYAQAGRGRRTGAYTDYSFAVWSRPPAGPDEAAAVVASIERREPPQPGALQLLPIAKAGGGLSEEESRQIDQAVGLNTLAKFGPVRSLRPTLVVELAFDAIATSARHKSGVVLQCPRLLRIRPDKLLHQADCLSSLLQLLPPPGSGVDTDHAAGKPSTWPDVTAHEAGTLIDDG